MNAHLFCSVFCTQKPDYNDLVDLARVFNARLATVAEYAELVTEGKLTANITKAHTLLVVDGPSRQ